MVLDHDVDGNWLCPAPRCFRSGWNSFAVPKVWQIQVYRTRFHIQLVCRIQSSRTFSGKVSDIWSEKDATGTNGTAEPCLAWPSYVQILYKILLYIWLCERCNCNIAPTKPDLTGPSLRTCFQSGSIWLLDNSEKLVWHFSEESVVSNTFGISTVELVLLHGFPFVHEVHFSQPVQFKHRLMI